MAAKYHYRQLTSYLLLLFFGLIGGHHIYLQRFRHAFVCAATLGGGFGVGLFFDLFLLRGYVHQANSIAKGWHKRFQPRGEPPIDFLKLMSSIFFSMFLCVVAISSMPAFLEQNMASVGLASALAVAIGTHTVSNIGLTSCGFKWCILPALAWIPFFINYGRENIQSHFYIPCILSSLLASHKTAWTDFDSNKNSAKSRTSITVFVLVTLLLVLLFFGNFFLTNVQIVEPATMEKVALKDYLMDVEWKMIVNKLAAVIWNWNFLDNIVELPNIVFRDKEVEEAHKTLNVSYWASNKEISDAYKELVKKYHPDKFATQSEAIRREAQNYFINIQMSYDLLANERSKKKFKKDL